MPVSHSIDTTSEMFGSAVTIAHLAANSFEGVNGDHLHIYRCDQILSRDWSPEIESTEMEYGTHFTATFKDGSRLIVHAGASCCVEGDRNYGNCVWCGGRYDETTR